MAKPEWGSKRTCHSCGARFFDLRRDIIVCPVCDTVYDPERQPRTRRGATAVKDEVVAVSRVDDEVVKKKKVERETAEDDLDTDDGEDAGDSEEKSDEGEMDEVKSEDSDLIEDTSDLGEDDDDIGEVMEHLDDDVEDKT